MSDAIDEVPGLYGIYTLNIFRKTPGVVFDAFPMETISHIDAVDRVIHDQSAQSPGPIGNVSRPWYMHTHQDDHLIMLSGTRFIELYNPSYGKIERFKITPDAVYKNGELVYEGGSVLMWPKYVFHRISSGDDGSASINLATHYEGFNIDTNFNIYDLDIPSGDYSVIRSGFQDQIDI